MFLGGYMNGSNNKLSIFQATRAGFKGALDNFFFFFKVLLAYLGSCLGFILVGALLALVIAMTTQKGSLLQYALLAFILFAVVNAIFSMYAGMLKLSFDVFDTNTGRVSTLFAFNRMGLRFLMLHVLYCIVMSFGFLLLIIPGIYWMVRFSFAPYAMVDKNLSIMESMRASWRLTHNNKWHILGILIVVGAISAVGQAIIVGLLVTVPMSLLMMVYAYRWQQAITVQQ